MAEPQPLTDAQIKQRDELNAQAAAYEAAQAEQRRKDKQAGLASAAALAKLLGDKKINDAFDTALNDPALDFQTKAQVQSLRSTVSYNVDAINASVAAVSAPVATAPVAA